ncbi:MAG: hypothetical protein ACT4P6_11285 [Gemmatimonadaceae bacterium]
MRTARYIALGFVVICVAPPSAFSQPAGVVTKDVGRFTVLPHNAVVRLSSDGRYAIGRFSRTTTDSLYLVTKTLSLAAVDSAWVQGRATIKGSVIGGVVGGLSFAVLGALAASLNCIDDRTGDCNGSGIWLATTGIGMVSGALIGGSLGSLVHNWRRVHP